MATKRKLGDLLIESGLLSEVQIETSLSEKKTGQKLGDVLLEKGYITEKQLIEVLEFQLGTPSVSLYRYPVDPSATVLVDQEFARRNLVVPLNYKDGVLTVAMNDPMDYFTIDDLEISTGLRISPVIATKDDILQAINTYYHRNDREKRPETDSNEEDGSAVKLVDQILQTGLALKASDIHMDPGEENVTVRYRVDGSLKTDRVFSKSVQNSLIARVKIMANLNITENRLPQDGRIRTEVDQVPVDLRISTLPTVFGEKVVIRLLDLENVLKSLADLDMEHINYQRFQQLIEQPSGLILLTGPTGSGKSSTLYAAINHLNQENVNIITVEDPVEYQLEGVNQVQVNHSIGLTFSKGLRSILRQDPNIIMLGEIRDSESAEIAVRASLTGHLVFSTLHTNSAVAAIPRLIDMEIEPYLVVSSLSGIMAQRLVKKICRDCKTSRKPTIMEKDLFQKRGLNVEQVFIGKGCDSCRHTGYRGRMAIHELLVVDDSIRQMMMNYQSISSIKNYIKQNGMKFLIDDGLAKAVEGQTTIDEVLRVAIED
ncbi:GspE/PulE family protein [Sediminibacillus massiliensis]|uniref:GspE/PulE family protein n=1 Tax=Sediminibacillus massiliensis TaxID=1926277 RepID=UPI0009886E0E|nr:ATPase, T2SS/T4P/T4SS family [Sediminibacillus massiliensis]